MTAPEDLGRIELVGGAGLRLTIDVLPAADDTDEDTSMPEDTDVDGCSHPTPEGHLTFDEAHRFARWCAEQAEGHSDDADRIINQPDTSTDLTQQRVRATRTKAEALRTVAEIIHYGPGGISGDGIAV